jgi:hypothetical protein
LFTAAVKGPARIAAIAMHLGRLWFFNHGCG